MPALPQPETTAAIVVAAGRGVRAGGDTPKQWQMLDGRRVIDWTLDALRASTGVGQIVVVLRPEDHSRLDGQTDLVLADGGDTRAQSVRAGLEALRGRGIAHVLIHDAARATLPEETISAVLEALATHEAAAPGLAVTDALWEGDATPSVTGLRDRTGLYRAQTPQGFAYDRILAAHRAGDAGAADDVEIARAAGLAVAIVPGHEDNIKITTPGDFDRAARILRSRMTARLPDIRTGNGFDVHRFGPGTSVMLCGVEVPHDRGLQGHSDADVGLHTVTDAIYGALAAGDIGRHFPPSDPQWKGAASEIFLRHAVALAAERGFTLTHADVTLICEQPKIGPHAEAMTATLAALLGIAPDRVSVKATTSERLGFTGRGEGIAALATVTLVKP